MKKVLKTNYFKCALEKKNIAGVYLEQKQWLICQCKLLLSNMQFSLGL